ncbi:MAG TPA: TetR/AcrR family transcriptional regulator C-terminal domain-containing protein [Candidatus Dormibacteraeota bacterium]|jgi:hypothetical protein|nr:TetR/AcrR family transcriptional regulator C-terminal domain-containing protein [Candidatus Dormibacteraeota bacterium]
MAAATVGPIPSSGAPLPAPEGWREPLRAIGQGIRAAMLSHRDSVRLVLSARPDAGQLGLLEALVTVPVDVGLTPRQAVLAFFTISNYVQGAAIQAQQEEDLRRKGKAAADPGAYPMPGRGRRQRAVRGGAGPDPGRAGVEAGPGSAREPGNAGLTGDEAARRLALIDLVGVLPGEGR